MKASLPLALLSLALPLAAQNFASVPAGLLSTEGDSYTLYFGSRASMRAQILTGDHRGSVRNFSQVALRRDGGRTVSQAPGRSWSSVRLALAEGSVSSASRTYSANMVSNIKVVYSGSMSWPTPTTTASRPSSWGTEVNFPFSSNYLALGQADLVMDFTFDGGTLTNGSSWTGYSFYYIDGINAPSSVGGSSVNFGTNNCLNAGHTSGAFCVPVFRTYAKSAGDKFEFNWWLYRYPANTLTAFALNVGSGSRTGVNIGNPCNDFFLTPTPQFISLATTPASNTGSFMYPNPKLTAPYLAGAVGLKVYTQAAYTHPTRNRFELTRGGDAPILAQPTPYSNLAWTWGTSATATTGNTPSQSNLPITRLTY